MNECAGYTWIWCSPLKHDTTVFNFHAAGCPLYEFESVSLKLAYCGSRDGENLVTTTLWGVSCLVESV